MGQVPPKIYSGILQLSILVLTWALVWFAFVYYPKITKEYKAGNLPSRISATAQRATTNFPIETESFKLIFEEGSQTYYAFIQGKTLDQFQENKNAAQLVLKNALSADNLCDVEVIYVSTQRLPIPQEYQTPSCP